MKIKECAITRYGPLPDLGRRTFTAFNLIFGENESGKTLILDAIIKMLFSKKSEFNKFHGIERVDEIPEGYLIIDSNGEEYKLPERGSINSIFDLSFDDFRNIFIIRSSDLAILDEARYYTDITERLTGLHSSVIRKIREKIQEIGKLTQPSSGGQLSDRKDWGMKKSRRDNANNLLSMIDELEKRILDENLEVLENDLLDLESDLEDIEQEIKLLEQAREREIYESGKEALSSLNQSSKVSKELMDFDEENLELWRDNDKKIKTIKREIRQLKSVFSGSLDISESRFSEQLENLCYWRKITGYLLLGSFVLTCVSIIGLILKETRDFIWIVTVASIINFIILIIWLILSWRKKDRENSISDEIRIREQEIEECQNIIRGLSEKLGIQTFAKFKEKYKKRKEKEKNKISQTGKLKGIFNVSDIERAEDIDFWNEKIQGIARFADKAIGIEFIKNDYEKLLDTKEELEEKIREIQNNLDDLRGELENVEREADSIIQTAENIPVETIVDLRGIKGILRGFIDDIDERVILAKDTLNILEKVEEQEAEKIQELFSKEGNTSKIFTEITKGTYLEIGFDKPEKNLWVTNKNGKRLSAWQLSSGAYNQLYMAIRLGLALKITRGEKGFLLLDDPFLASDTKRLEKQFEILFNLVKEGWQILYFSVKDEIRDLLDREIKQNNISLFELKPIYF